MDSLELVFIKWAALALTALALSLSVWLFIVNRRAGRRSPPLVTIQMILMVGAALFAVSGLADERLALVTGWIGTALVAFAAGRMWDPFLQHLRDVGLVHPRADRGPAGPRR